ncbi:MAG: DUF222 domain-containing protein [Acidimicrobiales bacterium]
MFETIRGSYERTLAVETRLAELMGVINAAHGEMVQIAAAVVDENLGVGGGVHTPAQYLGWRAGISPGRARDLVRIASRHDQLPVTVEALCAGTLTIDQAAEIAKHVPSAFEADATDVGMRMTVAQMRNAFRRYGYDDDAPTPAPAPAPPEDDAEGPPEKTPLPQPPRIDEEEQRSVSVGTDETGWRLNAHLPMDEGAVVERALRATYEDLIRAANTGLAPGEAPPPVTYADALVCMAETALRSGEARYPGTDRYLVHTHLETSPDPTDASLTLSLHLGPRLPRALAALLMCDPTTRVVVEDHGTPVNVGRTTRLVSRRLRRLIEHRDGGCAVPGCGRRFGLEIHHIHHWEHGGRTDTDNLLTLCRRHHRAHHHGLLAITGNPDLPPDDDDAVRFEDQWGRTLQPVGVPAAPRRDDPIAAGTERQVTGTYTPPLNERLCSWGFHLNPHQPQPAHPNPWVDPADARAGPHVA